MDYREVTEIIKEVTGLNVPVYFEDKDANYRGSAYYGLGEHCYDIFPEEFYDDPMFVIEDFIKNRHLPYYHVGLPDKIMKEKHGFFYTVANEQLRRRGIQIELTEALMEILIILHEFGHAHEVVISYEGNLEKYMEDTYEANQSSAYLIANAGLAGTEEGLRMHKELATEQYADNFALQHFEAVTMVAKERELI